MGFGQVRGFTAFTKVIFQKSAFLFAMSIEQLKQDICEIGRRAWDRGLVVASDGNISARIDPQRILCTPTTICKGFLKPADLCVVDLDGKQLEGQREVTSEIRLHLQVYRQRSDVGSVFHSHPPHATAFAVAGRPLPRNVLAEPELFLGAVPLAPYATPGSEEFAQSIRPFVRHAHVILLANHGAVSYSQTPERAFWLTEMLESYCRILILSQPLGDPQPLSEEQAAELAKRHQSSDFAPPAN